MSLYVLICHYMLLYIICDYMSSVIIIRISPGQQSEARQSIRALCVILPIQQAWIYSEGLLDSMGETSNFNREAVF